MRIDLFSCIIKKEYKLDLRILIVLVAVTTGSFILLDYSPAMARIRFDRAYTQDIDEDDKTEEWVNDYEFSDREEIIRFFDKEYKGLSINETIIKESYPYKYDPEFWWKFCEETVPSIRMQNRYVQEAVLERVQEVNNNPKDVYWGMGYTRTSNIYNLEKDFVYQYYSMGLIGAILLVGPYIIALLIVMISMLLCFKKRMTFLNLSLVLGCGLTCCLAYYSGNTLESLGVSIVIGVVYGYLLKVNYRREL